MIRRLRHADYRPLLLGIASFTFIGACWQLLTAVGVLDPFLASSPSRVAGALVEQARSGMLWRNLSVSLTELGIGFGLAALVGVVSGTLIGWYRDAEYALDPFIWLGYSAPLVALYPVFILTLGLGKPTVIAITYLLAVFPIVVNTARGVRNLDPKLLQAARSFGASDGQVFRKLALPASVPIVMAGLRLGVGRALVGVVVGELFGGNAGLGYSIAYFGGLLQTTNMIASVVVIGALGVLLTQSLSLIESRLDAWRPEVAKP